MVSANWIAIRTEYETANISYRKLAEKHGVSFPTLRDRAKREGWTKSREVTRDKVITKTLQKTVTKIAEREADRNARHITILDKLLDKAEQIIDSELNVHLDMFGKVHKSPIVVVERLEAMSKIIERAQKGQRAALGLDKEIERQRLELERKKLAIMENKNGSNFGDIPDDGFIAALEGKASDTWNDGDGDPDAG